MNAARRAMRRRASNALLLVAARRARRARYWADPVILVIQPDHLGDVLLSQPAVRLVRRAFPGHRLIALVGPWSSAIAKLAWEVDEIVPVRFPGYARDERNRGERPFSVVPATAALFAERRPDLAVVLRPDDRWSTAVAWAAGVPRIVAGAGAAISGIPVDVARTSRVAHRAAQALLIAAEAAGTGAFEPSWREHPLRIEPPLPMSSDERLRPTTPYALIHPGSGAAVKHWLPQRWRAVAAHLQRIGLGVVVTGGAGEAALCRAIATGAPTLDVCGRTNLTQLADLIRGARIVIGTDNGPLHLAVALGTPSIALFGPSDPREFGPWGDPERHRVVHAGLSCPRCRDLSPSRPEGCGCMLAITTEAVIAVLNELVN